MISVTGNQSSMMAMSMTKDLNITVNVLVNLDIIPTERKFRSMVEDSNMDVEMCPCSDASENTVRIVLAVMNEDVLRTIIM